VLGQDSDNRHLLIRNRAGDLAGFVEEVDEETAQPHMERALEGGEAIPGTPGAGTGTTSRNPLEALGVEGENVPAGEVNIALAAPVRPEHEEKIKEKQG
jgi:hypothetical protein